jgi:AraC-like DNA-binding protein
MTTTAAAGKLMVDQVVGSGPAPTEGWLVPSLITLAVIVSAIAVAAALRERHHRRRRGELQNRLAELEGILVGLSSRTSPSRVAAAFETDDRASSIGDDFAPRGALSTAISILRNDLGPGGLPGPDRVDLRATVFIYENLDQPIAPTDLAGDLNLSLRSLQRGLSTSLNCTPRELILAIKMREGKRLLLDEGCRVQEAARAVGFDDPFHFSRRFKAYYLVSPSEMQARRSRSVA